MQCRQKGLTAPADLFLVAQVRYPCSTCPGITLFQTVEGPGRGCIHPAQEGSLGAESSGLTTLSQVHALCDPGQLTYPVLASGSSSSNNDIIS